MEETLKRINFEIFYKDDEEAKKDLENLRENLKNGKSITEIFNRQYDDDKDYEYIMTISKINQSYTNDEKNCKCYIQIEGMEDIEEISLKAFRMYFRKFYTTRLKSTEFTIEENERYRIDVRFIRGKRIVVLALIYVNDSVEVNEELMNEMKSILQKNLQNSNDGRPTEITPNKISMVNMNYIFPYKKTHRYVLGFTESKKLSEIIDEKFRFLSEFKWLRLKTGIVLVSDRNGEYVNVLSGNKIDSMYVLETIPAFTYDLLMYMFQPSDYETYEINTPENLYRQIMDYDFEIDRERLRAFKDRFVSYYIRRFKYIENYESVRETKRALATMGR